MMKERVKKILVENFNLDFQLLQEESRLLVDLQMDSLDLYEFLILLEREFEIKIEEVEVCNFIYLSDVFSYLKGCNIK